MSVVPRRLLTPKSATSLTGAAGTSEIARTTGLSRQTVLRIKEDPAKAAAALEAWG
jgi:hypothetical protein